MCGITGFFSNNKPLQANNYYAAHYLLRHRGPDDEGFIYLDNDQKVQFAKGNDTIPAFQSQPHIQTVERTNLVLGQRRLAIIDLSKDGHQPFYYDGLYMVFNGELFNYKALREELQGLGYTFRPYFTCKSSTPIMISVVTFQVADQSLSPVALVAFTRQ